MSKPAKNATRIPLLPRALHKIVIVRALHIGDLLNAVPAFRSLRRAFPTAEITLVSLPWAREEFVGRFPYFDRFMEFPGYPGMLEVDVSWPRTRAFIEEAQHRGFDLAIQMHGDGNASNPFTALLGAKLSVGFRRVDYQSMQGEPQVTYTFPYPDGEHEVVRNLKLMEYLGISPSSTELEFPIMDRDLRDLEALPELKALDEQDRIVGLHVGARAPSRRWRPERFAEVGDVLAREFGVRILLTGGPGEEDMGAEVQMRMREPALNLVGKTSIGSLAALIQRMNLLITNDSGPSHISAALGIPSVILFGSADPKRWAPADRHLHPIVYKAVECSPCPHWDCPIDHRCMNRITAEDVLEVTGPLLGSKIEPTRRDHDMMR